MRAGTALIDLYTLLYTYIVVYIAKRGVLSSSKDKYTSIFYRYILYTCIFILEYCVYAPTKYLYIIVLYHSYLVHC